MGRPKVETGQLPLDLQDICENNHGGEPFSIEANESVAPAKAIQRGRIIDHLRTVGNATCDEAEIALGMAHQTASARFSELKRSGDIVLLLDEDGEPMARLTRNGRRAGVYSIRGIVSTSAISNPT